DSPGAYSRPAARPSERHPAAVAETLWPKSVTPSTAARPRATTMSHPISVLPYGPTRRRDAGPSAALARGGLLSVIGTQWEWFSNRHSSRRLLFPFRLGKVCVRCGAHRFRRDGPSHDPLA